MSIYVMLVKNSFRDTPDFLLRGFFHDQLDTPPHIQEFFEVVFILGGTGMHYMAGKMEPVSRGDILIIPAGGCHGYYKTENLRIFNLLFVMDNLPLPHLNLLSHPGFRYLFTPPHEFFENQERYPRLHPDEKQFSYMELLLHKIEEVSATGMPGRNCSLLGYFLTCRNE